jgi:hypothetical protein
MRGVHPDRCDFGVIDSPHADVHVLPRVCLYGRPTISYTPVSSVSRSPIRNSIGRTRVVPGGSGCGIPGNEGWTGLAFGLLLGARSSHAESRDESSAVAPIGVFVLFLTLPAPRPQGRRSGVRTPVNLACCSPLFTGCCHNSPERPNGRDGQRSATSSRPAQAS